MLGVTGALEIVMGWRQSAEVSGTLCCDVVGMGCRQGVRSCVIVAVPWCCAEGRHTSCCTSSLRVWCMEQRMSVYLKT